MNLGGKNDDVVHLDAEYELRFGIYEPRQEVFLQLLEGSAEIYGSQLHPNNIYRFIYYSSIAVFSSDGCVLKLRSSERFNYKVKRSEEVPIVKEYHNYLESYRVCAEKGRRKCPITLITGPTDVGKSTLCRFLLNYAVRQGRSPLFIDLDVGQSTLSIPGTFGVLPVNKPTDANGRFNEQPLSVYYFGYKSPGHNIMLYKSIIHKLGQALNVRLKCTLDNDKYSGVLIDTCGWINGGGYKLILEIVQSLEVNSVLVIGSKFHYEKLRNELPTLIDIRNIPSLRGVSVRNQTIRINTRDSCLYEYFYGPSKSLKPHTFQINFSEIELYKVKQGSSHTTNLSLDVTLVPIEACVLNQVLGVSYADHVEDILLTSVYGFICFVNIDMESETVCVLSPQPAPLPTKYLLMGDITFKLNAFDH